MIYIQNGTRKTFVSQKRKVSELDVGALFSGRADPSGSPNRPLSSIVHESTKKLIQTGQGQNHGDIRKSVFTRRNAYNCDKLASIQSKPLQGYQCTIARKYKNKKYE